MKNDYTYVSLLDSETTSKIREIQAVLAKELGHSEYVDQWAPHITLSFGNLLSMEELDEVIGECESIFKLLHAVPIQFSEVVFIRKEVQDEIYYALRLKIVPNPELDNLSEKMITLASKYEVPFDAFSNDHYHVGLGRYKTATLDLEKVKKIVDLGNFPKSTISSFSIFYSMMNSPKPDRAKEIKTFSFVF